MNTPPAAHRRAPRFSLRLKLSACMVAVALLIQVLLGLLVLEYQYTTVDRFFDEQMQARFDGVSSKLRPETGTISDAELMQAVYDRPRLALFENSAAAIYSPSGQVVASTTRPAPPFELTHAALQVSGGPAATFRAPVSGVFGGAQEVTDSRVAVRRIAGNGANGLVLLVVADDRIFEVVTRAMFGVFAAASVVGLIAWSIASWLIAGLAMAPLRALRLIAGSFSPETIDRDIEFPSTSKEIAALEQDLLDTREKLRAALRAQDRFISNVSHELNTPIAVLLTEAQTLPNESLSPEAREFAASVTEEMRRLGRMVGSFLTLTQVRGGHTLTIVRPTPINELVMDAVQECRSRAAQRGVRLEPNLSDAEPPLVITGDADLLRSMVGNLVRNAIRFSPPQERVAITVVRAGDQCHIVIRDLGRGVPESLMPSLFDRFAPAADRDLNGRGHGLGLSVAQGIAELHAGKISVRNPPEGGCEFTARLPLRPREAAAPEPDHVDRNGVVV